MANLADLLSKPNLTQHERAQLRDRMLTLEAMISNMQRLLSKTQDDVWIDYGAKSSVMGWSAFTDKQIFCNVRHDLVTVWFYIKGTSNSDDCTFTLPHAMRTTVYSTPFPVAIWDDSTIVATPGMGIIYGATSLYTVYVYKDWAGGGFTASGDKIIHGHFSYRKAP